MLEKRLNSPLTEEHPVAVDAVDKAVFHKLERLEAPYQPAHWEQLAARLNGLERRRRLVWITKMVEAAIVLLLLANLDGLLSDPRPDTKPAGRTYHGPVAGTPNSPSAADAYGIREAGTYKAGVAAASVLQGGEDLVYLPLPFVANGLVPSGASPADEALLDAAFTPLADVDHLPVGLAGVSYETSSFIPAVIPFRTCERSNWYVRTGASLDQSRVHTPDGVRTGSGYGAAVHVGYRKGKWGIEAGLGFNALAYEPKKRIEIFTGNVSNGYYGTSLNSVEAQLVSVPVKVTRKVANLSRGTLHAFAGASANLIAQKAYNYDTYYFPGSAPSGQAPMVQDEASGLRRPGRGALEEGGILEGNVFATLDAGLRYEQPIGKRFAAFVEPSYRMGLNTARLGPGETRVNTVSVQAGVVCMLDRCL
jgi:hypothetical protein